MVSTFHIYFEGTKKSDGWEEHYDGETKKTDYTQPWSCEVKFKIYELK